MRTAAVVVVLIGLIAAPAAAQGRGKRAKNVPPGHLPPPGACRVWYDDRPAGHQPRPTSCREAERIAARDPYARVIYGGDRDGRYRDGEYGDRAGGGGDRPRAVPRRDPYGYPYPDRSPGPDRYPPDSRNRYPTRYPDRYPGSGGGGYGYQSVPFDNGYRDGYEKGREDARDNDSYDPVRHSRYRSGDRGYDRRYGSKDDYKNIYREGFRAGYDEGYRASAVYGRERRQSGLRLPWPF